MPRLAWLGIILLSIDISTTVAAEQVHPEVLDSWSALGPSGEIRQLNRAISVDVDGNVFLVDHDWLHKFTNDGTFVYNIDKNEAGRFFRPRGVATDKEGNVYVASERVMKFTNDGELVLSWLLDCSYSGLAVHDSNIYIRCSGQILKYTLDGEFLSEWPLNGSGDVATDRQGNVYAGNRGQLFRFTPAGEGIGLEDYGSHYDAFSTPYGIAVDADGFIYVTSGRRRIRVFDDNGVYLAWWEGHASAYGIAIDERGNIYIADSDTKVIKYAPLTAIPPPPPPPPPPEAFLGTVMLHLEEATDLRQPCGGGLDSASAIVTLGEAKADGSARYFVYLLASPNSFDDGLAGIQFGIEYDGGVTPGEGLMVHSWDSCADLEWPDDYWPTPGSGNTITWEPSGNCQQDPLVVAGYFYLTAYSPSLMSIIGFPHNTGVIKTADCWAGESSPDQALGLEKVGWISLGGAAKGTDIDGCNPALEPCNQEPTPVRNTTWGRIKAKYEN